jgi:hypothetical protein
METRSQPRACFLQRTNSSGSLLIRLSMLPSVAFPYFDPGSQMIPFFFLTTAIPTEPKRIGGK